MIRLSDKQKQALEVLQDKTTNELFFGGAAGGAKSFLGCFWILKMCLKYPGTRWLIGRSVLKTLKETTIKTLFEVLQMQQIPTAAYRYNAQTNELIFYNKSEIIFKDLFTYPSDPNFDELGSLEISGAFIDEAIQVKERAINIVRSRIRFKLDEYGLIPKILYTSNPGKGWPYKSFWIPYTKNELPPNKRFIQSLLTDNPYISEFYAANLQTLDKENRERLLHGNWDYEAEGYVYDESKMNYFDLNDIDITTGLIIGYGDIADTGMDYFSFPIGCILNQDVYIIDWIYTNKPFEYWQPLILDAIDKNIQKTFIESNNMGLMATRIIKDKLGKPKNKSVFAIKEHSNKHERIKISAETDIIPNFYFLKTNRSKMYEEALEHLFQYRYDKTFKIDDAPDSLAGLSVQSQFYRKK
jgi:hypothetical protein